MAQKPDGKAAKTERVVFTRPAAERISKAVRIVESGDRDATGLRFGKPGDSSAPSVRQVRAATFTGSWSINASKVVTFRCAPTATQAVTNLSWPIAHNHTAAEDCIVGREGTSWWLVVPVLQTATALFVTGTGTATCVTDVSISATLNTSNCTISIGKTLATSAITVVSTTETATYLRLRVP
jgi:hypothetical protein